MVVENEEILSYFLCWFYVFFYYMVCVIYGFENIYV